MSVVAERLPTLSISAPVGAINVVRGSVGFGGLEFPVGGFRIVDDRVVLRARVAQEGLANGTHSDDRQGVHCLLWVIDEQLNTSAFAPSADETGRFEYNRE